MPNTVRDGPGNDGLDAGYTEEWKRTMFFAATTMRMAMRLPITSLCAAVIFAACHSAAPPVAAGSQPPSGPPVVVRGVVMDMKSNSPLSDAGIELQVPGRRAVTAAVTATDGRGEFVLDAVPPGTYRLRVTRVGFNELQMRVDVIRPDQGPLTIHLRALDIKCPASRYHTPECP